MSVSVLAQFALVIKSCSHTLSTGGHFEPNQSLHGKYYRTSWFKNSFWTALELLWNSSWTVFELLQLLLNCSWSILEQFKNYPKLFKAVQVCSGLFKAIQGCSRLEEFLNCLNCSSRTSSAALKLFLNYSWTVQELFKNCSSLFKVVQGFSRLEQFSNCSWTVLEHIWNLFKCSWTVQNQFLSSSWIVLELFLNSSRIVLELFKDCSRTVEDVQEQFKNCSTSVQEQFKNSSRRVQELLINCSRMILERWRTIQKLFLKIFWTSSTFSQQFFSSSSTVWTVVEQFKNKNSSRTVEQVEKGCQVSYQVLYHRATRPISKREGTPSPYGLIKNSSRWVQEEFKNSSRNVQEQFLNCSGTVLEQF